MTAVWIWTANEVQDRSLLNNHTLLILFDYFSNLGKLPTNPKMIFDPINDFWRILEFEVAVPTVWI